jgi:hypothetical protein
MSFKVTGLADGYNYYEVKHRQLAHVAFAHKYRQGKEQRPNNYNPLKYYPRSRCTSRQEIEAYSFSLVFHSSCQDIS